MGIEADEREFDISIDSPALPNMPAVPGPTVRIVMHIWMPKPGESLRVPAVREVSGYSEFAAATINPLSSVQKILGQLPLAADITTLTKDLQSGGSSVVLRIEVEMFMPMLDALLKQTPAGQTLLARTSIPARP